MFEILAFLKTFFKTFRISLKLNLDLGVVADMEATDETP